MATTTTAGHKRWPAFSLSRAPRLRWAAALSLTAILGAASGDTTPQVILATPGSPSASSGEITRYTLRFSESIVPLGDPRAPAPATQDCKVPATSRWVDERTFVFEFDKALPGGKICSVTLRDNLATVRGTQVGGARSFPIDTGGPSVRATLAGGLDDGVEEDQIFLLATNAAADRASVATHAYCAVDGIGEKIALDVQPQAVASQILDGLPVDGWDRRNFLDEAGLPAAFPAAGPDRDKAMERVVAVKCRRPLPPGRDMAVVWDARIAQAGVPSRTAGRDQRFDYSVRAAFTARFECRRVNPQAGCNPVLDATVRFSSPVPRAQALATRLRFADGSERAPKIDGDMVEGELTRLTFAGPFSPSTAATVVLADGIADISGRPLQNAARFPLAVQFDAAPPLVKFAAPFGIIEAREGGMLPVTVRAVESSLVQKVKTIGGTALRVDGSDGAIADWLRKLDDADDTDLREEKDAKGKEVTVNYTGTKSLLGGAGANGGTAMQLGLPGGGKEFEVVGIPLKEPGFYVVELASPALGASLLGRNTTRYVAAGALVTNMAVHFKWGREASLAWVTSLDTGLPVAGAAVKVTDSCTGKTLASGTADTSGRLLIASGLPAPETYADCDENSDAHPLMVSARSGEDFSFTLTEWGDGIRPYDFDLPYGWSERGDILHSIFDRSLVKAGESVSMKHILRRPVGAGFAAPGALAGTLKLRHRGSDTEFSMPFSIDASGIGENDWAVPKSAPMGDYDLIFVTKDKKGEDESRYSDQSIKVDEYRLPTMKATITGPKESLVRPASVPLALFVGYLSGGAAGGLPVALRTAFDTAYGGPDGYDAWDFGGEAVAEGTIPLDDNGEVPEAPLPLAQTLPYTLDGSGTARANVDVGQAITRPTVMTVEMDYEDANGETLTASRRLRLHPSAVQLGLKTDGWLMRDNDLKLKLVTLGLDGKPVKGQPVSVAVYKREIITARRRLIGGFYAYDNQMRTTRLPATCNARTDKLGLASCALNPGTSGEVTVVATTRDESGNESRAVRSVWLAGQDEWWFGGDNGDRMDVVPEQTSYKAGDKARFQVRMPFREATALVTVEREGVLSSFVTPLSGTEPVIEVPLPATYAPDVYVSVMAVRGRVTGDESWFRQLKRAVGFDLSLSEAAPATALVDLAKPSYRIGIARIKVGWEGHKLGVTVKADKEKYAVRETARVAVEVKAPGGKPPASAEIAFAAVDEALLQLAPNESWDVLDAMMGTRTLDVLTSTAQTQVVGKRHYGRKALAAGGGGGGDLSGLTREDFRPVLLWKGRVPLDAKGRAIVDVPLSDNLSSFKLVAIATSGSQLFGTGSTTVRTVQDLSAIAGLPPLVRTGDSYDALFTLRNGTDKPMDVTATATLSPAVATPSPISVTIPAGGAVPISWPMTAPETTGPVTWTVDVRSKNGKSVDRLTALQDVAPAVPVETWAASLFRVGPDTSLPIAPPAGALPGGSVDIRLSDTLAPPLAGVQAYMAAYPYNCFEQSLSRAVVLGDTADWERLAAALPTYLDDDGLLRYFPSGSLKGSPELTAYVLSMTSAAGLTVPDEPKKTMIRALQSVADGRLVTDRMGPGDAKLVRVAALAALARNNAASPALVRSVGALPADLPTGLLADWLTVVERTPGLANAVALRTAVEGELRKRLVYEGTRLDLADDGKAPWWMMVSGDEMAIKALDAVLGRAGWEDDAAKMMVGVAQRQRRGHWDTTPANAWGAVLVRRFAARYPATAIQGVTYASLGGATAQQAWPMLSGAAPLSLPLVAGPLGLKHDGAGPWATVSVRAAVPLTEPLFAGYRLTRSMTVVSAKTPGKFTRGDVVKIRLTVEASAGRSWVVINDPVPPGATILGAIGGQSGLLVGAADGGEGAYPAYIERGRDSWRGYFDWMPGGTHSVEYVVRLNGSGQFTLPPTRVEAMYAPSVRAQVPNARMTVGLR